MCVRPSLRQRDGELTGAATEVDDALERALRHAFQEVEEGTGSLVAESGVLYWVSHGVSLARNGR